jgi:hypothetical protein
VKLRLSDPAYTVRLAEFLEEVGHVPASAADGLVELADIPEDELAVYLRVWCVLEPEATVTVE